TRGLRFSCSTDWASGPEEPSTCARPAEHGVSEGICTPDPRGHNPVLCHLSYTHHVSLDCSIVLAFPPRQARQKGFEPLTHGLEGRCSIQLSYWRGRLVDVGASRFERPTTCSQGRCATRLRYAPPGVA